jgi:hypothetical protein
MIRANVRDMLDRDDAQLALRLIAQGSREEYEIAERQLRESGIDALLNHSALLPALLRHEQGMNASLPLFVCVAVRASLRRMGETDAMIADYLAALLLHFGLRDRSQRVSEVDDQTYTIAADIAADIDDPDYTRSFLVRAHMGNYALWLSGLFPDYIEHRCRRRGGPDLEYYEEMGRRGFSLASRHRLASENNMAELFRSVAERFLTLRIALNSISDAMLFPGSNSPDRLMRQVRDEYRWKLEH